MSPQDVPTSFQDYQHHGSLFTLFLHSPLTAVCYICNVGDVPIHHWERCQSYVEKFVTEASCLFTRCRVEDVGKNRDYIGMHFSFARLFHRHIIAIYNCSLSLSRFSLFAIFWRRFLAYNTFALHFLRCSTSDSYVISWTTSAATMRATIAGRFIRASIVIAYRASARGGLRCARSIPWNGYRNRMIPSDRIGSKRNELLLFYRVCLFACLIEALCEKQAGKTNDINQSINATSTSILNLTIVHICIRATRQSLYWSHINIVNININHHRTIAWITFIWYKSCWSLLPSPPSPPLLYRCHCYNHHLSLFSFASSHVGTCDNSARTYTFIRSTLVQTLWSTLF